MLAFGLYNHPPVQYRNWTDMLVAASSERPLAHDRLEAIPDTGGDLDGDLDKARAVAGDRS
jgi:hypothetical protein